LAKDWKFFYFIDAREAKQYANNHIYDVVNFEWRQVLARRAELPMEKSILIYCNTCTLSVQAEITLHVAGMDNMRIMQDGFNEWNTKGSFDANRCATE